MGRDERKMATFFLSLPITPCVLQWKPIISEITSDLVQICSLSAQIEWLFTVLFYNALFCRRPSPASFSRT